MSTLPSSPARAPLPPRVGGPVDPARPPGWGWLEWTILAQVFIPALLFVPGLSAIRTFTRVGVFAVTLVAWVGVANSRQRRPSGSHPSRPWLLFVVAYQLLSVLHPSTNSLVSGLAQVIFNLAVLSPIFWAGEAVVSPRQLSRVMAILFLANALGALVGIGQVYRPEVFNPPEMAVLNSSNSLLRDAMTVTTDDGRQYLRPCGLTDSPGSASSVGAFAAIAGLSWALVPMAAWKRLASLGLACGGAAVIYFSQVRSMLVVTALIILGLIGLLVLQKNFRRAATLGLCGAGIMVAAMAWAVFSVGSAVTDRVNSLVEKDAATLYQSNRGFFVVHAFETYLPMYPLGAGLGRWGTIFSAFGDRQAAAVSPDQGSIYVEVQITAWVIEGGAPLLVAYAVAMALALVDSARIALRSRDRDVAFWAAVVCAANLGTTAMCFDYTPFCSLMGIQFWMLTAVVHAADHRARATSGRPGPPRGGAGRAGAVVSG